MHRVFRLFIVLAALSIAVRADTIPTAFFTVSYDNFFDTPESDPMTFTFTLPASGAPDSFSCQPVGPPECTLSFFMVPVYVDGASTPSLRTIFIGGEDNYLEILGGFPAILIGNVEFPSFSGSAEYTFNNPGGGSDVTNPGKGYSIVIEEVPTPEPSSLVLICTGAIGLFGLARRRVGNALRR